MNVYDAIKILGITDLEEITPEDVKKAYRQASKKYHPDCNPSGDEMMNLSMKPIPFYLMPGIPSLSIQVTIMIMVLKSTQPLML